MRLSNGVCILTEASAKLFLETEKTKAETKKIEAEKMVSAENTAQRAYEIDKLQKELAHELSKMDKQLALKNQDATAASKLNQKEAPAPAKTNAPSVPAAKRKKSKPATAANARMVPLAIYKKSNTTTPLTQQQKLNKNNKAKQERLDAKAYRASLATN